MAKVMQFLKNFSLDGIFFPKRCLACHAIIEPKSHICVDCINNLPFTNWEMNQENLVYVKIRNLCEIESAYSLLFFQHGNVVQKIIHALKYKNMEFVGELLAESIPLKIFENQAFDGIIYVPNHHKILQKRGYNQLKLFSQIIGKKFCIPLIYHVLNRKEFSKSQINRTAKDRLKDIQHAFALNTEIDLKNGHYLLIDDTITTGATLSVCVNILKSNFPESRFSILSICYAK